MSTTRIAAVRPVFRQRGFTLIELLVVIAIIALLAALLFPVFASVREKARQATALSNMHQIELGMAAYQLDYHQYPPVLFGYANSGQTMAAYQVTAGKVPALFPQYVKDYHVFLDPNNNVDATSNSNSTQTLAVQTIDPTTGMLSTSTTQSFYTADAYDISPEITGPNAVAPAAYVPRYQLNWTGMTGSTPPTGVTLASYQRQLRWKSVPGDTYVTCTTYHVANANKVLVLYEGGDTKTLDESAFLAAGPDVATLSSSGNVSNATFWEAH